jgi:hypothetical protein
VINANEFSSMNEQRRLQWINTRILQEKKFKILTKFQVYEGVIKPLFEVQELEDINYRAESLETFK